MIYYQDRFEGIDASKLEGFFKHWHHPETPEHHFKMLKQSSYFIVAIDSSKDRIIGSITVLTDDVQVVYISMLEVLAEYRGQGIGSELVRRILKKYKHIPAIDLMCAPTTQAFYKRLGMQASAGMVVRNHPSN